MAKTSGPFPSELSPTQASKSPQSNGEGVELRSRLGRQIIVYFLLISLLPLAIVATVNLYLAKQTLIETESDYLEAIAVRQIDNIRTYLNETQNIVGLIAENPGVVGVLNRRGGQPTAAERRPMINSNLQRLLEQEGLPMMPGPEAHHEGMRKVVSKLGFNRIYLVNPEGQVVFAIPSLESRYRNLKAPDMAEGELAKLFSRTTRLMSTQASDFRIDPATGEPALFISAPVLHDGRYLGVVILAPKNEEIFGVLSDFEGMSQSGEVILAARDGDDILFLNDLRNIDSEAFTFRVPYRPEPGQPMLPVQEAVRGKSGGGLVKDYRGVDVAAGWEYLPGLRMGLVMKVDVNEVFAPITQLTNISLAVAVLTALVVIAVAFALARGITRPIILLTSASNRMADGDLTGEITCDSRNEIGQLSQSARIMASNLKSLIGKVKVAGGEIGKTAQHLTTSARQQVVAAEQTGTASVEVNTTAKQISTTAQELASTMQHVNEITQEVALNAEKDLDVLQELQRSMSGLADSNADVSDQLNVIQEKANAISGIVLTMTKVADQTNLLSLNAAIEARKAGDYGRGFSVVALEIRRLADQAAVSTLEIESSVKEMLTAVSSGVQNMSRFSQRVESSVSEIIGISGRLTEVIQQVQGLPPRFDQILEGMQTQTMGASQINESMTQLSSSAQKTASAVKETHHMLNNLRRGADVLQAEIERFKTQ